MKQFISKKFERTKECFVWMRSGHYSALILLYFAKYFICVIILRTIFQFAAWFIKSSIWHNAVAFSSRKGLMKNSISQSQVIWVHVIAVIYMSQCHCSIAASHTCYLRQNKFVIRLNTSQSNCYSKGLLCLLFPFDRWYFFE